MQNTLGVVVGRFQLPELHDGHKFLIDYVAGRNSRVLVVCGNNDVRPHTANPYPPAIQEHVVRHSYPDVSVSHIPDSKVSPAAWSQQLDSIVREAAGGMDVTLYGSRDSFLPLYSGEYETEEVVTEGVYSATSIRAELGNQILDDPIFRMGWLAAISQQYAVTDPTVDVCIVDDTFSNVLFGRRGEGAPLRFIGGFTDPTDESYEVAVKRERSEEVLKIKTGEPIYIGSHRVNDSRYKHTKYGIMTAFFAMKYISGEPVGGDDMPIVEWAPLLPETKALVDGTHQKLFDMLWTYKLKAQAQ
jgi:bifunctional NMN adenylyltransferase/nudix hydrolase